jgi:hypothetical protein
MNSEIELQEIAIIADLKNRKIVETLQEAFEQAGILPLIRQSREIYVHIPLGATFFRNEQPIAGTYLDVEFAEAIALISAGKPVIFYEAPATAHRNVKNLFEKLGYTELTRKYSHVRILCLEDDATDKLSTLLLHYGFDYPPVELPGFLFDNQNLIISFSNPKAPFSNTVAGFKGLPFSLSGKSLIIGSTLFPKKNLLHLAFRDVGLGLKGYVVDALDKIHKAGVKCVGINGGRFAGAMIDQVKVHPVDWNILVVSTNIGIADVVAATLMGFQPQEIDYFTELIQKALIPSELNNLSVIEIGDASTRLKQQLKVNNPFRPQESSISTRKWIFGILRQVSFKDRLRMVRKILPSVIRYKFTKKRKHI